MASQPAPIAARARSSRAGRAILRPEALPGRQLFAVLAGPAPPILIGVIAGLGQATKALPTPLDAALYWRASQANPMYAHDWTTDYNFASPPPIAQLVTPFHGLPWEAFIVGWTTLLFACLWVACRKWTLAVIVVGLVAAATGVPLVGAPLGIVLLGNVGMLMTAGIVLSLRSGAFWVIPAVTKVGPSVGVLWHVLRREWAQVAAAAVTTIVVVGVSFLLGPAAWADWVGFVARNYGHSPIPELPIPFVVRAAAACLIVAAAVKLDRPWLVLIGAGLAIPADYGASFVTVWVGALGAPRRVT